MKVGDKVTVIPFDELDKIACNVDEYYTVHGITKPKYNRYVGDEYTISKLDDDNGWITCELKEDSYVFTFPIGCLKKL